MRILTELMKEPQPAISTDERRALRNACLNFVPIKIEMTRVVIAVEKDERGFHVQV